MGPYFYNHEPMEEKMGNNGGAREGAGRKRGQISQAKLDLREAAMPYAALALRTLAQICRNGDTDSARVSAANSLLDRGYGRPIQSHRVGGLSGFPLQIVTSTMTDAEAAEAYATSLNAQKG